MTKPFRELISELEVKYATSSFLLSKYAGTQKGYVEAAIRDTSCSLPLRMAGAESITDAVMLAGKLGVNLDPSKGLAELAAFQSSRTKTIGCVLNLSLEGMMDAFSRVNGMKVHSLQSANDSHQLNWKVNELNASVSVPKNPKSAHNSTGAICVIELDTGDRIPTVIRQDEIIQLAKLANLSPNSVSEDFALKQVFKRALKTLVSPSNSQLNYLQQAAKLIDIYLFEH